MFYLLVGAKEIVISSNIKGSYAHPRCDTVKSLFFNPGPCRTAAPPPVSSGIPNDKYVQCWSKVDDQRKLYKAEFCNWNQHEIRQTTKEDYNGNVIWKDVVTNLKKQTTKTKTKQNQQTIKNNKQRNKQNKNKKQ